MFFAPKGYTGYARHGKRILPEIQMELLLSRFGQCTVNYTNGIREHAAYLIVIRYGNRSSIQSGNGIMRNIESDPYRLYGLCLIAQGTYRLYAVCH